MSLYGICMYVDMWQGEHVEARGQCEVASSFSTLFKVGYLTKSRTP